ncbi:helix-turn-helix domain-containing protein [Sorangium sp. So ce1078]|uniref:AraC family transcriptional regulator n=1 Tax=Sorangium sp. So ce1078 TaxID=3133329 RepID=UPI003F6415B8
MQAIGTQQAVGTQEHGAGAPRPHLGLRVDVHTAEPGPVTFDAAHDHRVRIHAGPPARGRCHDQRFVYSRGDLDLIPAGYAHGWYEDDASTSLLLELSPSLLRRAAADMGLDPDRVGLDVRHQIRDPQIEHIAWALDAERMAGYPNGLLYRESLGVALAVHLLGRFKAPTSLQRGLSRPQLRRLLSYIEDHLDQDLSLERLAGVAGVSASHLKTLFKRSTGLPVHEYVIQRRVERAKALLLRGELPASQVAIAAGFSHQSHMARCMRRVLGVTPAEVARAARVG